jgi:hypothetical protein
MPNIPSFLKNFRTSLALTFCIFSAIGSMNLAYADSVKAPPRPTASASIVVKPGEQDEVRAKLIKKQSNIIKNTRDYTKDDTLSGVAPPAAMSTQKSDQTFTSSSDAD